MHQYHKIQTIFKRDEKTMHIVEGDYSLPELEYLKDNAWVFDEKVDGTNIRVMWDGKNVILGGKTDNAQMPVFLMQKLQQMFDTTPQRQAFKVIFNMNEDIADVCLYGEGYGAKIQKGGGNYVPNSCDFVLFDVKVGDLWLERANVEDIGQKLGVRVTPILGEGTLQEAVEMTRSGFKSQWGDFIAEGLILRPKVNLRSRRGDRIITKIKHKDFQEEHA
jgi:hypothetical protein